MNADEARKQSIKNQNKNEEIRKAIKSTDEDMQRAISKGKRECVLRWRKANTISTLVQHYEEKGFKVGQFKPPQITYYIRW